MGLLLIAPQMAFADGAFAAGARARFYEPSTTTPAIVYADAGESTPHPSPLEADGAGVFPQVFGPSAVKVVITDAAGDTIDTLDPVYPIGATGASAAAVSYAPQVGNPSTNVQAAIDLLTAANNSLGDPSEQGISLLGALTAGDQRAILGVTEVTDDDDFAVDHDNVPTRGNVAAALDFPAVLAENAYVTLPNGLIMQAGYAADTGTTMTVTYPTPFLTRVISVQVQMVRDLGNNQGVTIGTDFQTSLESFSFIWDSNADGVTWFAIGH